MAGPIVDLILLRGLFADTALRPGLVLPAKVLEREGPRGMLLLNGVRVPAQLPPQLVPGDALRVRVQEVSAERLALQVVTPETAAQSSPPTLGLALPGGAQFRVDPDPPQDPADPGPPTRRSIALSFDSPALGRLDFLIDLDPDATTATVGVAAGAAGPARSAADELRDGLGRATGRAAAVHVQERGVDVRA